MIFLKKIRYRNKNINKIPVLKMQKNESVDQERQIIRLTERLQDLFRKSGITGENVMHLISSYFTMALFTKDRANCSDLFDPPHESYYTLKDKQAWEDAYQMLSL